MSKKKKRSKPADPRPSDDATVDDATVAVVSSVSGRFIAPADPVTLVAVNEPIDEPDPTHGAYSIMVSVNVGDPLRELVAEWVAESPDTRKAFEDLYLTIAFVGRNLEQRHADAMRAAASSAIDMVPKMLQLDVMEIIGAHRDRLVVKVKPSQPITALRQRVLTTLIDNGVRISAHVGFSPHITVALAGKDDSPPECRDGLAFAMIEEDGLTLRLGGAMEKIGVRHG